MSENLIPLFTGHPSWYVSGGSGTIFDTITVASNDDGSFTINGQTDSTTPGVAYRRFYFHVLRHGTSKETDLHLSPGVYKLTCECNGVEVHNGDSTAVAVDLCSFPSGSEYYDILARADDDTIVIDSSVSGDVFLSFSLAPGNTFTDFNVKATLTFVSAVLPWDNTGNLFPQFSGYPDWYIVGGSSSASLWDIKVQSDGSFLLNGTPNGSHFVNYQILKKGDLILAPGNYQYKIKFDGVVEFSSSDPQIFFELISVEDDNFGSNVAPRIELSAIEHEVIHNFSVYSSVNVAFRFFTYGAVNIENLRFKPYVYRVGSTGNDEQAPVITVHPQSITVAAGHTATFSITATGSNLLYNWEWYNGTKWVSLGHTTSSFSFIAGSTMNGRQYHCIVTGDNGNFVVSNPATLTVTSSSGGNDNPTDPTNPGGNENPSNPGGSDTPSNPTNPSNPSTPGTSANTHTELSELFTGTQSYTFSEDYFSSGRIYWRVRSYDSDGNPGEWSESVSFICYGVSKVQDLACDAKPFATITWTANGQVSYEIKIDDVIGYGPFHGTDGRFVLAEPLEDGHHKVSVRVQNNLGLESPWDEIEFDVQNIPSDDTTSQFVVQADVDASLWWTPPSTREEDEFLVYRDNKLIRRFESSVTSFCDRVVLGYHTYKVIQHLPSGYYNLYAHPEVFLTTDITKIGLLSGGPWLNLTLTTDRHPTNTFKQTRIVERTRVMGSKYPVVEISDFEELSATYEVVWPYEKREAAYQFKKLLGKAVIVKSRGEQVVVGVLDGYELPVNSQTVGYSFTIEQMDFDDDASIIVSTDEGFGRYTDLDKIAFGLMTNTELALTSTNPGTSNPQYYEQIAEAINDLKRCIAELRSEVTTNG